MAADVVDVPVEPDHQRVAGALGEPQVELLVGVGKGVLVGAGPLQLAGRRLQAAEVLDGGVQRGEPGHLRLDPEAHLDQLEGAGPIGHDVAVGRAVIVDVGAAADAPGDQLEVLEAAQGFADGAARGGVVLGQVALRRQALAVGVGALEDGLLQRRRDRRRPGGHRVGQRLAALGAGVVVTFAPVTFAAVTFAVVVGGGRPAEALAIIVHLLSAFRSLVRRRRRRTATAARRTLSIALPISPSAALARRTTLRTCGRPC